MNYIAEIKAFNDLVQIKQLSTGQIALWYALMYINNKCAWKEWFNVPNITLELHSGLSRSAILKNRNVLKQLGLIDFKANGTKATTYKLIPISKSTQESVQDSKQDSKQVSTQDGVQDSAQSSNTLNKLNETKLNYINNDDDDNVRAIVTHYENLFGTVNSMVYELLITYSKDMDADLITHIMDTAHAEGKRWKWIEAVIINSLNDGIKTKGEYIRKQEERRKLKDKPVYTKPTKFNDYEQEGEYDFDEIERRALEKRIKGNVQ